MLLTEERPSSGTMHEHKWQILEDRGDHMVLVCAHDGCAATKRVEKPQQVESVGQKPLLLG